jgi:hypothetical protein
MTFTEAVRLIERATTVSDLGATENRTYRELVKLVHPDAAPAEGETLVKVPRDPADNDLMAAEARALSTLGGERRHDAPRMRPQNARHLLAEFDEL